MILLSFFLLLARLVEVWPLEVLHNAPTWVLKRGGLSARLSAAVAHGETERFPSDAAADVGETERWAAAFVAPLGLCPWAAASLAASGAVQYEHTRARTREGMNAAVTAAAGRLLRRVKAAAEEEGSPVVTAANAITFIVAPEFTPESFLDFYEYEDYLEYEGGFLDEAPFEVIFSSSAFSSDSSSKEEGGITVGYDAVGDFWDCAAIGTGGDVPGDDLRLGDVITAAGFHPLWDWGDSEAMGVEETSEDEEGETANMEEMSSDDEDDDDDDEEDGVEAWEIPLWNDRMSDSSAISWEKRAPLPTISLVLACGIERLGEGATGKVSTYNAGVLKEMGATAAEKMYVSSVLLGRPRR